MHEDHQFKPVISDVPKQSRAALFMALKRRISGKLTGLPRRAIVLSLAGGFSLLTLTYLVNFYRPQTMSFSYAGQNCMALPTLMPGSSSGHRSRSYVVEPVPAVSIGEFVLYAHNACITPEAPPSPKSSEQIAVHLPGVGYFKKTLRVNSGEYPRLSQQDSIGKRISTKDQLQFRLTQADRVFAYHIKTADKQAACTTEGRMLNCDLPSMQLAQAATYDLAVERHFEKKPVETALRQTLQTVEPIQVVSSSITPNQMVYNAPADITVTLNKPLESVGTVTLKPLVDGPEQFLPMDATISGETIKLTFKQPLPRSTQFRVVMDGSTSVDGGYLSSPYTLLFETSGGPKVTKVNIGNYKISPGQAITLAFDSNLAPGQNLAEFIKIDSGGTVAATLSGSGNQVTIRPASLGTCAGFTVKVLDGLKNEHGISGGSAWSFSSRITCQQPFSIGSSVKGRGITGYRFGSGDNKIVYVGGTHGNERSSVTILNRWIEQLEAQAHRIPSRSSIIVIPVLNPDGYASNTRTNANNVDLNRNFPAFNWKSGVTLPDKSFQPTGGGTESLSEPESRAIADYLVAQRPRLVMTYHASGNVVIPNDSGDSASIAKQYANKSAVYFASNAQTATIFEYDTTGAMEDWLHDKHSITTNLVELYSYTSNDFGDHETALWWTAGL